MMVTGHLSDGDEWYLLQEPGKMEAEEQREFLSFSSLNYRPVLCIFQRKIPLDLNQALQFLCPLGCLRKNLTTTFPNLTRQASLEDWTTTEFLIGMSWLVTYCYPPVRSSPVHASILSLASGIWVGFLSLITVLLKLYSLLQKLGIQQHHGPGVRS